MAMFESIAAANGLAVDDDQTGTSFSSLATLEQYDVIVFSNTSGDNILDPLQQANFETYMVNGGAYLGIHAASDTYRHSSANGSNTGSWDFYAELVGASVQQSPNHVNGTPEYAMEVVATHPTTQNLPDPWVKNEEYYYWENGYFGPSNIVVLQVEETVGPNGFINSYDAERPMSWYRELPGGGKMFYTALGHAASNYTSDQLFIQHMTDAMLWLIDLATSISPRGEDAGLSVRTTEWEIIVAVDQDIPDRLTVFNSVGQAIRQVDRSSSVNIKGLPSGMYLLEALHQDRPYVRKVLIRGDLTR